jgi:hypothetical protein
MLTPIQFKWNSRLLWVLAMAGFLAAVSSMQDINHDIAIAYDVGLRHLDGQRLYKDFYMPFGPLSGLIFAIFLAFSPTGGLGRIQRMGDVEKETKKGETRFAF